MPSLPSRPHPVHRFRELAHRRGWSEPGYQAFRILQGTLLVILVVGGFDKFTRSMIDWTDYIAPVLARHLPTMLVLSVFGLAELIAGLLVAIAPRLGAYVAAGYVTLWTINVVACGDHSDAAFWTLGLAFACLALARLAPPRRPAAIRRPTA